MNEIKRTKKSKAKKTELSPKNDPKTVDYILCLTMIVKNESKIIRRCLDSVKEHIDYWVIVDTGSTDGTQDIIKEHLKSVPGELHEEEFVNFGYNRTESVKLSKGKSKYILLMDADLELKIKNTNFKNEILSLDADCFLVTECDAINKEGNPKGFNYRNRIILKNNLDWVFAGSTHEVVQLENDASPNVTTYDGIWIHNRYDGGSKSEKFARDITLLLGDYEKDDANERTMFYLGESYIHLAMKEGIDNSDSKCIDLLKNAIHWYKKRSELKKSWPQEVYFSLFKMAKAKTLLDGEIDTLGYLKAYNYMSSRIEPIHQIIRYCREEKLYNIGYLLGKMMLENEADLEKNSLFVDGDVYLYQLLDEFSVCASWSGHNEEAVEAIETILPRIKGDVDEWVEERIIENLKICRNLIEKNV